MCMCVRHRQNLIRLFVEAQEGVKGAILALIAHNKAPQQQQSPNVAAVSSQQYHSNVATRSCAPSRVQKTQTQMATHTELQVASSSAHITAPAHIPSYTHTSHPSDMRYGRISSRTVSTFSRVSVSKASGSSSSSPMSAMPGVANGDSMSVDDIRRGTTALSAAPVCRGAAPHPRTCCGALLLLAAAVRASADVDDDEHERQYAGPVGTNARGAKAPAREFRSEVAATAATAITLTKLVPLLMISGVYDVVPIGAERER